MSIYTSIAYYITLYMGIFIYIFGFSGSLLNIRILFSTRHNPCTFLLMYSSIIDCFVLNIGLLFRILSVGFNIDPTLSNLMWCKIRTYGLRITTLISLYTVSLMSIERYFVSCRTVRIRQLSNMSFIRWVTFFMTFVIAAEGLPFFILTQILRTNVSVSCTPMYNTIFATYASYFCIPVLFGILPLSIMIVMGTLIYYQLHNRIHLRKAQRSLTLIILVRILVVLISCGPYTSYFVYSAIVSSTILIKSANRIAIENCILAVISIFLYITYSSSFFIYYHLSPTYRKQLIQLFRHFHQGRRHTNVVRPAQMVVASLTQKNAQNIMNNKEENDAL